MLRTVVEHGIEDVARAAGVSTATVSRALAGKEVVSSKTAERIRRLAKEHGFTPSSVARNLRTRRRGAIGVVIPLGHERGQHISDPFFMTLIGHLADELTERGFDLVLSRVIPDRDDWLQKMIDADRVDGFIVIGQSDQSPILDAAALGFLGMGAQPPTPEWGTMLAEAREFIQRAWWVVTFPGLAILITVVAINLMGDGLRDALDPKLKRS